MSSLGVIAVVMLAAAENLLQNPSFESLDANKAPNYWDSYVMAQDGSFAQVDSSVASDGQNSAEIRNKSKYTTEPYNNWSQNVLVDLSDKTLELQGSIKTDNATSAAIWVQCWHKEPLKVVKIATTKTVAGTADWTRVDTKVTVPKGTDFIVVRCVLKGSGTAWFDGLSFSEAKKEPTKKAEAEKPKPRPEPEKTEENAVSKPDPDKAAKEEDEDQSKTLNELKKTVKSLRDSNRDLSAQVTRLNTELRTLKEQVETDRIQPPPPVAAPAITDKPKAPVPPLVPHGMKSSEFR